MTNGILNVVATPIGNLDDITLRALETLRAADVVAAEDTRHTRKLFDRHGIETALVALHEHNEAQQAPGLIERMKAGETVALVSDAGTPLISDPGFRLVQQAVKADIRICPIPGVSSVTAALSVCALPTDRFVFEGFLPAKQAARRTRLEKLRGEPRSLVFFESSHRISASLEDLADVFGNNRQAALCREMTKQFETILRGSVRELIERLRSDPMQNKGEFVMVVAGQARKSDDELAAGLEMATALLEFLPASQAAKVAARLTGASRRAIYKAVGKQGSE
jgi:16S rRNA (cytidine1402-2'-O)-methyltransferase